MVATERTVLVRLRGDASSLNRALLSAGAAVNGLRKEIDTTNDRTAWLAQGILALAPAAMPIGAAIVPAISGLATQLGLAVGAAGTLALGFNGIGDSFKALNEYQLEPTAENLAKVREEFNKIGPDGADFVMFLDEIGPKFTELQMAAREGMFPGMIEGLEDIVGMLPQVKEIVSGMAEGIGTLSADAGAGLSGEGFEAFFDYLETHAEPLLVEMGRTIGNFAEGLANMLVAFSPVTAQFSSGFLEMSRAFAEWSSGLGTNDSFQSFLQYVQEVGPMVLDLFGSLVDVIVEFAQAAAPIGELMIPALTALADITATLINTPLGPMFVAAAAAMSIYGRAAALASITTGGLVGKLGGLAAGAAKNRTGIRTLGADLSVLGTNALTAGAKTERMAAQSSSAARRVAGTVGKTGAAVAGLALITTGAADSIGLTNTATLALAGSIMGIPGAIAGGALGAIIDLSHANDGLEDAILRVNSAIESGDLSRMKTEQAGLNQELGNQAGLIGGIRAVSPSLAKGYELMFGRADEGADAQARLNSAMRVARGELKSVGDVLPNVASASRKFALASQRQALALKESRASARETAKEFITLGDGLDNAKLSLNGWLRQLEKQAEALRDFRKNAEQAANRGLRAGLIAALEEAGPAGALRMRQLANATDQEIARANKAWQAGQREVNRYTDVIGGVPREVNTKVKADTADATSGISWVRDELNELDGSSATVTVYAETSGSTRGNVAAGRSGRADGGRLPGDGMPYGDRVPIMAAPTEYIVSNRHGQVDRHLALLEDINSNRFADGGRIPRAAVAASHSRSMERVVERMPDTAVLVAPGFGEFVVHLANQQIRGDKTHTAMMAGVG